MQIIKGAQYKLKNCGAQTDGHIVQSVYGKHIFKWVTNKNPAVIDTICYIYENKDHYLIPMITIKEL